MPCHDIEDDAGLYRFIPDSKNITIIVVSLLFQTLYVFYWNNNLSYVLASQPQQ